MLTNEDSKCEPLDFYGVQKLFTENYLRIYSNVLSKLNSVILRVTNPFGNVDRSILGYNFINNIILKLRNDEEIIIYGKGQQIRDYIHITDLCSAVGCLLENWPNKEFEIYNVGSSEGLSIIDAIRIISSEMGVTPRLTFSEWPIVDERIETGNFIADTHKLSLMGWTKKHSFLTGIRSMIN